MSRKFRRVLAVILAFAVVASTAAIGISVSSPKNVAAKENIVASEKATNPNECQTECHGNCEHNPVIMVPGIFQSAVYMQDENGEDMLASDGAPIVEILKLRYFVDLPKFTSGLLKKLLPALLLSLVFKRDVGFSSAFSSVLNDAAGVHYFNDDGTRTNDIDVDTYEYSYGEYMKTDADGKYLYPDKLRSYEVALGLEDTMISKGDAAFDQIRIQEYGEIAGYDHMYYFAYPSLGDVYEVAEDLKDYIDLVKVQTGHDEVNLVFVSLGGTVATAFFDLYENDEEVIGSIDRVVFGACAMDGSKVLSDLISCNLSFTDPEFRYSDFLPEVFETFSMSDKMQYSYLLNIVIRIIPEWFWQFFAESIEKGLEDSVHAFLVNAPSIWTLVPSEDYPAMAEKYISDDAHAELKAKTDRYYQAQLDNPETITGLQDDIVFFSICGYGLPILPIFESCKTYSSDNIIHSSSESMNAYFAPYGETLPEDYVQAYTNPDYPNYSYISPDRTLDASAGYLPDHTWYLYKQSHLMLNSNNDIISLCVHLALDKDIISVHDEDTNNDGKPDNGGYRQFNDYRDVRNIAKFIELMKNENGEFDQSKLVAANPTESQRAEFIEAFNDAEAILVDRHFDCQKTKDADWRLYEIMNELGLIPEGFFGEDEYITREAYESTCGQSELTKKISDIFTKMYGLKAFFN